MLDSDPNKNNIKNYFDNNCNKCENHVFCNVCKKVRNLTHFSCTQCNICGDDSEIDIKDIDFPKMFGFSSNEEKEKFMEYKDEPYIHRICDKCKKCTFDDPHMCCSEHGRETYKCDYCNKIHFCEECIKKKKLNFKCDYCNGTDSDIGYGCTFGCNNHICENYIESN